ncbi:DUF4089 domain-containing protein [Oricola sp.]|uniref:DUF4089 domain-containing protein n=1 Tax=Oricola sp. TaxID=1979950 RepID=UPI0025F896DC|nr:DUF4089 domain-containing protein [Oricola sp.]MCI5076148.1 DUF4089 domain-containing protein [Oricola sp.]
MSDDTFDVEAMIDAMAAFLDLPVEESYRPGIAGHLTVARAIAADVLSFDTSDEAEPAPVFRT